MQEMAKKSRKFVHKELDLLTHPICQLAIDILDELDVEVDDTKDLHKAVALISPFFFPDFLESEKGQTFKDSLLFNHAERAKNPPNCRSNVSNKYLPKDFFDELDAHGKRTKPEEDILDTIPMDWDRTVRPIIAHRKPSLSPFPHPN